MHQSFVVQSSNIAAASFAQKASERDFKHHVTSDVIGHVWLTSPEVNSSFVWVNTLGFIVVF